MSEAPARVWRLGVDGPTSGARNMARDHAMALGLPPGEGAVRFYRWRRPTVSLGRNEPARGLLDEERLAAAGFDWVRRPTGGRTVLHHRELTYAVAVGAEGPGSPRRLYRKVNGALVAALRTMGVPAQPAPHPGRSPGPDAGPCFELPAEGEVTVGGRKLVGSAQVRLHGRLLQHGSILLADDQGRLPGVGATGATSLAAWLDPVPEVEVLIRFLVEAFAAALGGDWHGDDGGPTLDPALETHLEAHYRSPEWTWRR